VTNACLNTFRAPVVRGFPAAASAVRASHLSLLPSFELRCAGEPVELPLSAQRVLAFLALQERPVLRVHVAGTLWPDSPEERAHANLRSAVWRLRRPGLPVLEASATHLGLARSLTVDVAGTRARARRLLGSADGIEDEFHESDLRCDLLSDWYEDWVLLERERFRQLRLHALELLCERLAATGRFHAAVEAGLVAVAGEPLRESAQRALIRAHLAEGNVGEAIRQYRSYRTLLADELGLRPSPALEQLVAGLPVG
jgi:DNA-binding SARP family transcriptional activator